MSPLAIIGGGYAGLAAGVELAAAGQQVTVFETSRTLGGRARRVNFDGIKVDNGQHILIGAYSATLALLQRIGVNAEQTLLRLPLTLDYPGAMHLAAPRLPAPLHLALALLTARGLGWSDKLAAIRFMQAIKARKFSLPTDMTVAHLLDAYAQPAALRRYLWEPLCISALNTQAAQASAQVFLNVLRDSLAANRQASDLLLPQADLSALLAEPAAAFIKARGGAVLSSQGVERLEALEDGFRINGEQRFSRVILAVAPYHLPTLIANFPALTGLRQQCESLTWEPIVTCYLRYPPQVRLSAPMLGFADGHLQWLFDRGQLGGEAGLLAAVISAHGRHQELSREALGAALHAEIATLVPNLPAPLSINVITERRATFACTPGLSRPGALTAQPGLFLAGDYVASDYPATIESAVRSGIAAARLILQAA